MLINSYSLNINLPTYVGFYFKICALYNKQITHIQWIDFKKKNPYIRG